MRRTNLFLFPNSCLFVRSLFAGDELPKKQLNIKKFVRSKLDKETIEKIESEQKDLSSLREMYCRSRYSPDFLRILKFSYSINKGYINKFLLDMSKDYHKGEKKISNFEYDAIKHISLFIFCPEFQVFDNNIPILYHNGMNPFPNIMNFYTTPNISGLNLKIVYKNGLLEKVTYFNKDISQTASLFFDLPKLLNKKDDLTCYATLYLEDKIYYSKYSNCNNLNSKEFLINLYNKGELINMVGNDLKIKFTNCDLENYSMNQKLDYMNNLGLSVVRGKRLTYDQINSEFYKIKREMNNHDGYIVRIDDPVEKKLLQGQEIIIKKAPTVRNGIVAKIDEIINNQGEIYFFITVQGQRDIKYNFYVNAASDLDFNVQSEVVFIENEKILFSTITKRRSCNSCPLCGGKVVLIEKKLKCANRHTCQPVNVNDIMRACTSYGLGILEMNEILAEQLIRKNIVNKISDLYSLKRKDFNKLENISENYFLSILDKIENSLNPRLANYLYILGYDHKQAQELEKTYLTFDKVKTEVKDLENHEVPSCVKILEPSKDVLLLCSKENPNRSDYIEVKKKINELTNSLKVNDSDFDILYDHYNKLKNDFGDFDDVEEEKDKILMKKFYSHEETEKELSKFSDDQVIYREPKVNGFRGSLEYFDGELKEIWIKTVTKKEFHQIKSVPKKIEGFTGKINGEFYVSTKNLELLNKNNTNKYDESIKALVPLTLAKNQETNEKYVDFFPFQIVGRNFKIRKGLYYFFKEWGFSDEVLKYCEESRTIPIDHNFPFDVDGFVFKDDLNNMIAYKYRQESFISKIKHIEKDKIFLQNGTSFINGTNKDLGIGDKLKLSSYGKNKISFEEVVEKNHEKSNFCPLCYSHLRNGKCTNKECCKTQLTAIFYFCRNMGITKETKLIKKLYDSGVILNRFDLFNLKPLTISNLTNTDIKKAEEFVQAIENSKERGFKIFLRALKICSLTPKKINLFKDIDLDNFSLMNESDFMELGLGKKLSSSLSGFLKENKKNLVGIKISDNELVNFDIEDEHKEILNFIEASKMKFTKYINKLDFEILRLMNLQKFKQVRKLKSRRTKAIKILSLLKRSLFV